MCRRRSARRNRRNKLATLARVIGIPESSVQGHLNWATGHFQDIVQKRTGGLSPFGNIGVRYSGTGNAEGDAALNAPCRATVPTRARWPPSPPTPTSKAR